MPWITPEGKQTELNQPNTRYPNEQLTADFPLAELLNSQAIVLTFESPSDGKAFSWCSKLRRNGYIKPIAAAGEIGLDRAAYAFRCGFTLVWLSDQEASLCKPLHLKPFSQNYQPITECPKQVETAEKPQVRS